MGPLAAENLRDHQISMSLVPTVGSCQLAFEAGTCNDDQQEPEESPPEPLPHSCEPREP